MADVDKVYLCICGLGGGKLKINLRDVRQQDLRGALGDRSCIAHSGVRSRHAKATGRQFPWGREAQTCSMRAFVVSRQKLYELGGGVEMYDYVTVIRTFAVYGAISYVAVLCLVGLFVLFYEVKDPVEDAVQKPIFRLARSVALVVIKSPFQVAFFICFFLGSIILVTLLGFGEYSKIASIGFLIGVSVALWVLILIAYACF